MAPGEAVPLIAWLELGEQGRPPPLRLHDRPRREVGSEIPGMMLVLQQRDVLQKQTQKSSLGWWQLSSKQQTPATQNKPYRYSSFEALGCWTTQLSAFCPPKGFPLSPSPTTCWDGSSAPGPTCLQPCTGAARRLAAGMGPQQAGPSHQARTWGFLAAKQS